MSDNSIILNYLLENSEVAKRLNEDEPIKLEVLLAKYTDFDATVARIATLAQLSKDKFKPSNSVLHRKYPYDAIADATIEELVKLSEIAEYLYLTDTTLDKLQKVMKFGIGINAIVLSYPRASKFDLSRYDSWAKYGDIAGMEWLLSLGYDPKQAYPSDAVEAGELEALKWLHRHGCEFRDSLFYYKALEYEQYGCMNWLYEIGCPMNEYYNPPYSSKGLLNGMKWFYNHGAKFHSSTYKHVALYDCMDGLEWLHNIGIPLPASYICGFWIHSRSSDTLKCLKWLYNHGVTFHKDAYKEARNIEWTEGAAWLREVCID